MSEPIASSTRDDDVRDFHVAGVGASAGGLEALEQFFDALPDHTGMAFVVVQHLSPDFKSHMEELLSRHTRMPILRVENEMRVAPDTVYLIPRKMEMVISGGRLLLTEKSEGTLSHPIDQFFRSLASDCGRYAIGLVLSGTGSDGSRGIRDIHDAGGLVIAQSQESAKFDGMPMNAQTTGVVDLVLPPAGIAEAIVKYVQDGLSPEAVREHELLASAAEGMDRIFQLLHEQHGIDFTQYKSTTVGRRVQRRIDLLALDSVEDYIQHVTSDSSELNELYKDLLIGVTKFFRDPEAFQVLQSEVIPRLFRPRGSDPSIRMWVAGCASGEEAYSLAILVDEEMRRRNLRVDAKIFATDIHHVSLHVAAKGIYPEEALSELSEERRRRYFHKRRDGFHVAPEIRKSIIFAPHNLIGDAPFTQMDLVSCRNLLIYLQPSAQKKGLSLFHFALKAGGTLFLGPSESPGELSDEFQPVDKRWRIYTKRRDVRLPLDSPVRVGQPSHRLPRVAVTPPPAAAPRVDQSLLNTYDRLLDRKLPPSILVNESLEILHVFGGAERFIESKGGRRTNQVLDVITPKLKTPLSGALHHALRKNDIVKYTGIEVDGPGGLEQIHLTVEPVPESGASSATNLLVEIKSAQARKDAEDSVDELDVRETSNERIAALESELRFAQENLQATIEEMETANEELQATNEELVASNEELQSTNEELHSVNEELYTVNAEHQRRVEELAQANSDMDNLLATTRVGVIYLDDELFIRRYTPAIASVLHLVPHDVGRSIEGFAPNLNHPQLLDDLKHVLEHETEREVDVSTADGTTYLVRMLPYRRSGTVRGVVVTLIDVTSLKRAQADVVRFKYMTDAAVDMQVLIDENGRFSYVNPAFCTVLQRDEQDLLALSVADVDGEFDLPRFRELFDELETSKLSPFESVLRRADGERLPVEVSASRVTIEGRPFVYATLRDITRRHEREAEIRIQKAAIDAAANGILIADNTQKDHPITYVNEGFTQVTGYSAEEALGRNCRFLQGKETDEQAVDELREAIANERDVRVLLRNYRKDGTAFWNDLVVTPVRAPGGEVTHFVGVQTDVTERVDTAARTRRYAERLAAVLDTTFEGIYGIDESGACTFCNRAAREMLGYGSEDEILGKNMHELIHHSRENGDAIPAESCRIYEASRANRVSHVDDEVFWRQDGSCFPVEYASSPMVREGVVLGAVITFKDATEERRSRRRIDRLGRMVDRSHDAILAWSRDDGIESWNSGAAELYGYSEEEALGKNPHELLQSTHSIPVDDLYAELIERGEWSGTLRHVTKHGDDVVVSTRQQLWRGNGEGELIFEINRDVTEQRRTQAQLERANAVAQRANEAKSEFLANMSHELRTPMTAVLGFADMLRAESERPDYVDKVLTIKRNGEYLLALLNDILDLSKIEAGKMHIEHEPVEVRELMADVQSLMNVRATEEGIPLHVEWDTDVPQRITADRVRVRQILVNLIGNALKFTDDGEVRVAVSLEPSPDGAHLKMCVRDTGIGMTQDEQRALFQPFTQASSDTARTFGGTGLGLSISKRLATRMGGDIEVESERGVGSSFSLKLPVTPAELDTMIGPDSADAAPSSRASSSEGAVPLPEIDARVLLADDRRDVWRVVRYFLEKQGADVVVTEDGRQAVDEAIRGRESERPFDLVLMDMRMPVMNGREAVIELRRRGFTIPIITLTADAMGGEREACIEAGCDDYLPKPVDGPVLVRRVASLLSGGNREAVASESAADEE